MEKKENLNREIKTIKRTNWIFFNLKITISEKVFKLLIDLTPEEKGRELENRSIQIIPPEQRECGMKKKRKKHEQNLKDIWDNIKDLRYF